MKIRHTAARGFPLAVLLVTLLVVGAAAAGDSQVQVQQSLSSQEIYLPGSTNGPATATLTLTLTAGGPANRFPIDCVFVIDTSATADINEAAQTALGILAELKPGDRVGVVSFATQANLVLPLTDDLRRVKEAIRGLARGGKSALGDALQLARQELVDHGRADAVLGEILLTDGQSDIGSDPQAEVTQAKKAGIKIVSVGIGTLIDRNLLEKLADQTGGLFFPHPTDTTANRVMSGFTVQQAATDITIKKVLPAGLSYAGGDPAPTQIDQKADGTTVLTWKIGALGLGAHWTATVALQGKKAGKWDTDAGSSVSLTDFRGVARTISISPVAITVLAPNKAPKAQFSYSLPTQTTSHTVKFTDHSFDPDGTVVSWSWEFGDGAKSTEQNPQHRYLHPGTYWVKLTVTDNQGLSSSPAKQKLEIPDISPTARFEVKPETPCNGVEVTFDASKSTDPDGKIVSYAWDFNGDGVFDKTTASPQIAHSFPASGKVQVTLVVTDDFGKTGEYTKTIEVLPSVTVTRTIDTCLPDDETIAGGKVKVTVTITANTIVNGLSLEETLPQSFSFTALDNSHATLRPWHPGKSRKCDWLFMETLKPGDKRVISYTLTAPAAPQFGAPGQKQFVITGAVGSASPQLSQAVLGEDKITVVEYLPIPVVISRWNTKKNAIDLCLPPQISFDQIQYAVSLWISGDTVPYTKDAKIDLGAMQKLIAYWLTGTSVHDPLP